MKHGIAMNGPLFWRDQAQYRRNEDEKHVAKIMGQIDEYYKIISSRRNDKNYKGWKAI